MYHIGRLPSKKYRALPWGLSTTVACTRVADYHPKNAVHYRRAGYHCSMYQSGRLPSEKTPCITMVAENRGKCYQPQKLLPRRALALKHAQKNRTRSSMERNYRSSTRRPASQAFVWIRNTREWPLCGSATPSTGRSACRLFSGAVSIPRRGFVIKKKGYGLYGFKQCSEGLGAF